MANYDFTDIYAVAFAFFSLSVVGIGALIIIIQDWMIGRRKKREHFE